MKKSTIAVITVTTLLAFHGAHLVWGWKGVVGAFVATGAFCLIARTVYWRRLRRLQGKIRGLSYEERRLIYEAAGLDAEARRDMEKLRQDARR